MNYSKIQLNPIIKSLGIDVKSPEFEEIIDLFDGQTNYHIWALKMYYKHITDMDTLKAVKKFTDKYQNMISSFERQTITAYNTPELMTQLIKEMIGATVLSDVKKCINGFNTLQRGLLRTYIFGSETAEITPLQASTSEFIEKCDLLLRFSKLHTGVKQVVIKLMSAVDNIEGILKGIKNSFEQTYIWEKSSLLDFIKKDKRCSKVKVVYDKDSIVVLEIPDFDSCNALCFGRAYWCLTRDENTFNSYAKTNSSTKQFFYFDFSKDERCNVSHIGFTLDGTEFLYAHDADNNNLIDTSIYATVRGKSGKMRIKDIIRAAEIPMDCFVRLNGVPFEWSYYGVTNHLTKNSFGKIVWSKDNRLCVEIDNEESFYGMFSNTMVNYYNLYVSIPNTLIYGFIDTNVNPNNEKCMVIITIRKDSFGVSEFRSAFDAFGHSFNFFDYAKTIGFDLDGFIEGLNRNIQPELIMHKFLAENNEDKAIEILKANPDMDINFNFQGMNPIFIASSNGMYNFVDEMLNHPKFEANIVNAIDEPLLQTFIYDYRRMLYNHNQNMIDRYEKLIKTILANKSYDFNAVNGNLDSAIMVAAENSETNWIVKELLTKDGIDLNLVNDVGRTIIGNALFFDNTECFELVNGLVHPTDIDIDIASEHHRVIKH